MKTGCVLPYSTPPTLVLMTPGGRELPYEKDRATGRVQFTTEPIILPSELSLRVDREANWGKIKGKLKNYI